MACGEAVPKVRGSFVLVYVRIHELHASIAFSCKACCNKLPHPRRAVGANVVPHLEQQRRAQGEPEAQLSAHLAPMSKHCQPFLATEALLEENKCGDWVCA